MKSKTLKCLFVLGLTGVVVHAAGPKPPSHEEEVVRTTYATLSFLCSLKPIAKAAEGDHNLNEQSVQRESDEATPVFEITHVQVGNVSSISSQSWGSRFSVPDKNLPAVLASATEKAYFQEPGTQAQWTTMVVHWDVDNSYSDDRLSAIQSTTVGQAVKMISSGANPGDWPPGKYTTYATFQVTVTYQGRTVGPYTASFFFGTDAKGKELVAPVEGITSGLFDALRLNAYPSELLKTTKLRQHPILDHWIQANSSSSCSSVRADLCCSDGRCMLPQAAVLRDSASLSRP